MEYQVKKIYTARSVPTGAGLHVSQHICNNSSYNIGVIDKHNNRKILKPTKTHHGVNGKISITTQELIDEDGVNKINEQYETIFIDINGRQVADNPVYVKELDLLFCSAKNINKYNHPLQAAGFDEAVERMVDEIKNIYNDSGIRFIANDPDGKIKQLIIKRDGVFLEIHVCDFIGAARELVIIYPETSERPSITKSICIDKILAGKGYVEDDNFTGYIGIDKKIIKEAEDRRYEEDLKAPSPAEFEKDIKLLKSKRKEIEARHIDEIKSLKLMHDTAVTQLKSQHTIKLQDKLKEIEDLNEQIKMLQLVAESKTASLNVLQSTLDSNHSIEAQKLDLEKRKVAVEGEKFKSLIPWLKIGVPMLLTFIGTKILTDN